MKSNKGDTLVEVLVSIVVLAIIFISSGQMILSIKKTQRNIEKKVISKDDAKKTLNKQLNIESEGFACIPTEWKTEILCYEFKGKVDDKEFLVYINAENGKEEDILVIKNTPNGVLTM